VIRDQATADLADGFQAWCKAHRIDPPLRAAELLSFALYPDGALDRGYSPELCARYHDEGESIAAAVPPGALLLLRSRYFFDDGTAFECAAFRLTQAALDQRLHRARASLYRAVVSLLS
jgi:hypothetical protein